MYSYASVASTETSIVCIDTSSAGANIIIIIISIVASISGFDCNFLVIATFTFAWNANF